MANICVYCGSSPGSDPAYAKAAEALGAYIGKNGHTLIYGAGNVGLMGIVADTTLAHDGEVIGVIPEHLVALEVAHNGLTESFTVSSMHERKAKMAELADCFIALPGGVGTLEEIVEIFVWSQLGLHRKACGLLNVAGFYDNLVAFLQDMTASRFLKSEHLSQLLIDTDPAALTERLLAFEIVPIAKLDRSQKLKP